MLSSVALYGSELYAVGTCSALIVSGRCGRLYALQTVNDSGGVPGSCRMLWSVLRGVCEIWIDLRFIRLRDLVGCGVLSRMQSVIARGSGCGDSEINKMLLLGFIRCAICRRSVWLCFHRWQIARLAFVSWLCGLAGGAVAVNGVWVPLACVFCG